MSRLFIELYLDEDVDVLLAELVRGRGFSAGTTREAGHLGRSDADQLTYAAGQKRTLFTHNRVDFENLAREYWASGRSHHGIIIAVRRLPHDIVRRLLPLLNQITADEMINQVRYI